MSRRRFFSDDLEMIYGPIEIILAEKNPAQHEVGTQVGRVNLEGLFELVDRFREPCPARPDCYPDCGGLVLKQD